MSLNYFSLVIVLVIRIYVTSGDGDTSLIEKAELGTSILGSGVSHKYIKYARTSWKLIDMLIRV